MKKLDDEKQLIVSLYVDDLLVTRDNEEFIKLFKSTMEREFEMPDLGEIKYFLEMETHQSSTGIFVSQRKYASEI